MPKLLNRAVVGLAVVVCVGWIATQSRSQQQPGQQQGAMPPEMQKQMEAWMKLAELGKEHEALKPMAGKFNCECSMVMAPGTPEQKTAGSCENELIFGGRFLQSKFKGEFMGQPFEGIGYTGYDNYKKKYISTWTDSMSTMIMFSEGTGDPSGKVITLISEMPDPTTNKMQKCRTVLTVESNDKHTMRMFSPSPTDGKEYNGMTIVYTRAK
jgi:Protein of unknown function (DUF1579)